MVKKTGEGFFVHKDSKGNIVGAYTAPQGTPIYEDVEIEVERTVTHEDGTTETVKDVVVRRDLTGYEPVEGEEFMPGPMPELYQPVTLENITVTRNKLLADSDWIVMRAMERGEDVPQAWRTYRDKLRAIDESTDLDTFKWPKPPAA